MSAVHSTPMGATRWRRQRDTRDGKVAAGKQRMARFDLGLALLEVAVKPGHGLTCYDIADWCGVTDVAIYRTQQTALRKIRNRFRFGPDRGIWKEKPAIAAHL